MPTVGQPRRPTAIGAYVFAGGFTLGMEQAGFRVTHHLEDGRFGVDTAVANFPSLEVRADPSAWPTGRLRGGTDVVFCNPPCSPWSTAGISPGWSTEDQVDWRSHGAVECMERAFSLLTAVRPRVWCVESVRQLYTRGNDLTDEMSSEARTLGYKTYDLFTEARYHGVPQRRRRYFMVLSGLEVDWVMPDQPEVTVYEALLGASPDGDMLQGTPSAVAAVMRMTRQGENVRKAWDREKVSGRGPGGPRPAFIYDRLSGDRPSYTILGSCNKLHPDEDRLVTVNETKALCGFPASFVLVGSRSQRYSQLGKGVCPPVARWLGENLARAVARGEPAEDLGRCRIDVLPRGG